MQNIKNPVENHTSRANETHNPAHPGGDWYWACWNYFRLSILSNSKKMASPSVPSISRVETSSESSSDSTSTTTSTVSEHSKTSNIINRYSCSVERGLYWVPYGFGGLTWTRLVSPGQWQRLSQCAINATCRLPQYRVPVPTSRDVSSSETESDDLASGRVSFVAGRRIESWEQ